VHVRKRYFPVFIDLHDFAVGILRRQNTSVLRRDDAVCVVPRAGPDGLPLLPCGNHARNPLNFVLHLCRRSCCSIVTASGISATTLSASRWSRRGRPASSSSTSSSRWRWNLAFRDRIRIPPVLRRLNSGPLLRRSLPQSDNGSQAACRGK